MVEFPLGSSLDTSPGILLGHLILFITGISDQSDRRMRGEQENVKGFPPSELTEGMKLVHLAGGRQEDSSWEDQQRRFFAFLKLREHSV